MRVKPTSDRVLVKPEREETTTASGLELVKDTKRERPDKGVVVAVGPGRWTADGVEPMPCVPGDRVLFGKFSGQSIGEEDEELFVLRGSDIMGVIVDG